MITISNSSQQFRRFYFRTIGSKNATYIDIPSGQQVQILHRGDASDHDFVARQLQRMAARSRSELLARPDPKFRGLIYTMDKKPFNEDEIKAGAQVNTEGAEITSAREVMKSVMGADRAINQGTTSKRKSKMTGLDIKTLDPMGKEIDGINMDMRVEPEGQPVRLPS